ncbi:MAG: hypothetical protein NTY87_08915 [Planctomycetia bacterium]|nr:hypothetical protein [Planctomycetia bacterium]
MDLPIFPRFISVFLAASLALPLSGSSLVLVSGEQASAADLAAIAAQPLGEGEAFRPVSAAALNSAASRLRLALTPLDSLLARSPSGANWKAYLDWPALTAQAAAGKNADVATLRRLRDLLNAEESGLEMHQFAATRRAVSAYTEAAEAAQMPEAPALYKTRLEKIAAALAVGAAAGTTDALQPLGPLLAKLEESSQAPTAVARVRGAINRPNLYLDVDEALLATAVNRAVDQTAAINDVVLGTRIRGMGHTEGVVLLDFVPSLDRAVVDLSFDATNYSNTSGSSGPVTVCSSGVTKLDARKRILVDSQQVLSLPVEAHAKASTTTTGMSIKSKFGKKVIQKIATRKISEMRPQAEAVAGQKAQERVRREFDSQISEPIAKAASDYQTKFRRPLLERGWYPEMLQMSTSDSRLSVVARKSLSDQIAAFTPPPAVDPDAVLAIRVHETLVNNAAEISLGGRTITQADVEKMAKERGGKLHESLTSEPDQPPWSITFARSKPIELDADDSRAKVTLRGSKYTSGEREFPAMDVWVAYRIEPVAGKIRLIRDGEVQIYPPGFVPGGAEKLTIAQTSLRGILKKRLGKVFQEVVDIEPLELQDKLAPAGPLPVEQFVAQKDGWVAVGWRKRDATATLAESALPIEPLLAMVREH